MLRMLMIPLFIACFYLPESWLIGTLNGVPLLLKYVLAAVVFLLAYVTDTLDGRIARARGLVTDFGKLMDPTADKLLTSAALIMLCRFEVMSFGNFLMPVFTFIIIAREIFVSGIRQLAAGKGIVIAAKAIGNLRVCFHGFDVARFREETAGKGIRVVALVSSFIDASLLSKYDASFSIFDDLEALANKINLLQNIEPEEEEDNQENLSQREKEIVVCVVKGMTNKEIAEKLFLSIHTVITHRRNISKKLQIHSAAGLTIYAIVNKLVELSDVKDL